MSRADEPDVTLLLAKIASGDASSREALLDTIYPELRAIAGRIFAGQGSHGHTLQPTAVVHEAYLKMVGSSGSEYEGRRHFLRIAAKAMRQVLLNHARDKRAGKRGGSQVLVSLDSDTVSAETPEVDPVELDDALRRLEELDERQAQVVELRFFGGLTIEETAEVMGISATTVKQEWRMARAELALLLGGR